MKYETRYIPLQDITVRANDDGTRTFSGYAAVYDSWTTIGSGRTAFRERVAPGAFDRALAEGQDVRHLINHDANMLLGRTTSGTTRLASDGIGLRVETDLPDTTYAHDLAVLAERGDLNQMSFGFRTPKGGDKWERGADGMAERSLIDLDALDVSSVTFPAYPETSGEVRSQARAVTEGRADVVAFDDEAGFSDFQSDIQAALPTNSADMDGYPYGWVMDVALDMSKALVSWTAEAGADTAYYVVPLTVEDGEPQVPDFSEWTAVDRQYVAADAVAEVQQNAARMRDLESRAGKVMSETNAAHLKAALAAHADAMSHMQAIADAAGVGSTGDGKDDTDAATVTTEGNSAAAGETRDNSLGAAIAELQAYWDAR